MNRQNIGVMLSGHRGTDYAARFREAREMGLSSCQISLWDPSLYTDRTAQEIRSAMQQENFRVSLLWAGWSGPCEWNFSAGPDTIGLVPPAYRHKRLEELIAASDFAEKIGVTDIATHVGFIPENPADPNYPGLIAALRFLCRYMQRKGQFFLFETGQETPVTMLRTIERIGLDNLGINFDTANLILYGRGNPVDAIRVFGKFIRNTHIKDGFYPTDGENLGVEVKVGQGLCDLPRILHALRDIGYSGPYTIEREISGDEQKKDIADTLLLLQNLLGRDG